MVFALLLGKQCARLSERGCYYNLVASLLRFQILTKELMNMSMHLLLDQYNDLLSYLRKGDSRGNDIGHRGLILVLYA